MIRGNAAVRLVVAAIAMLVMAAPAAATEIYFCKSLVTRPISGMEEEADGVPRERLAPSVKAGTIIRHVTQYVVETKTGLSGFCAHLDRCYRDTATVHGRRLRAQRLLNCKVDFRRPDREDARLVYGLVADRRKVSAKDLRAEETFARLVRIGIESERLAYAMVDAPRSRCARLAQRALAGDRRVQEGLAGATAPPLGEGIEAAAESVRHPDIARSCI